MLSKQQVELYMKYRKEGKTQKTASAKSGMCERSGRAIDHKAHPYFQSTKRKPRTRRRPDPFEKVWENELIPILKESPHLQAKTLLEHLQNKFPEKYPDRLLRTMQRRVKVWKALHGEEKEVIFRQIHIPGQQGISDFTVANKLGITIKKKSFDHRLYHFRLSFSGWEYAKVILGGESFTAIAESLQDALRHLGGSPKTHRTDSLSAAYKNLSKKSREDFTKRYKELCAHYQMKPTRNNKGISHENGSIESPNRHLKSRIEQGLILRRSKDFDSIEEYQAFVDEIVARINSRNQKLIQEELKILTPLPEHRSEDFEEFNVQVASTSTINVKKRLYSVPSRFIGSRLKIHLYDNRLELYLGATKIETLQRLRAGKTDRRRSINYTHIASSLVKKPQAFRNYIFKDDLFPNETFRKAWQRIDKSYDERKACREYTSILYLAVRSEDQVTDLLSEMLNKNQLIESQCIIKKLGIPEAGTNMRVNLGSLKDYDQLLGGCK
jgi:transposase InsO family protein